eukprot:3336631-Rhodomonas_salina.2
MSIHAQSSRSDGMLVTLSIPKLCLRLTVAFRRSPRLSGLTLRPGPASEPKLHSQFRSELHVRQLMCSPSPGSHTDSLSIIQILYPHAQPHAPCPDLERNLSSALALQLSSRYSLHP